MIQDPWTLLAPEAAAFLEHLKSLNAPHTEDIPIAVARMNYEKASRTLGGIPVSMARIEDRVLSSATNKDGIPVRIYWSTLEQDQPLLMFIHGGGWNVGSINTHDTVCRRIAKETGCIIVSIEYRLAPEHPYPAGLEDVQAAYQWCLLNAESLGADSTKVAVGGDSAGGNLTASLMSLLIEKNERLPDFHVLMYPCIDLSLSSESINTYAKNFFISKSTLEYFVKNYTQGQSVNDWKISPLLSPYFDKYPPAIMLTTECDPLHDESMQYKDKLTQAGVAVSQKVAKGTFHAYMQFTDIMPKHTDESYTWLSLEMKKLWSK
ncbi:alpha/beta hydrolase [Candidatus Bodocaedibacter vickermanii]|uniref:Alpha/beta hydrolase n=1 Tax=Candidatus Bodocaedibacter vickermanii TaxID=2741701 RepID=A0A7L9RSF4_9PROT|nr:alpha/beta hydrolase [Candidatus Paracaedibacteraceae bacterium 'Lake Konstanz']